MRPQGCPQSTALLLSALFLLSSLSLSTTTAAVSSPSSSVSTEAATEADVNTRTPSLGKKEHEKNEETNKVKEEVVDSLMPADMPNVAKDEQKVTAAEPVGGPHVPTHHSLKQSREEEERSPTYSESNEGKYDGEEVGKSGTDKKSELAVQQDGGENEEERKRSTLSSPVDEGGKPVLLASSSSSNDSGGKNDDWDNNNNRNNSNAPLTPDNALADIESEFSVNGFSPSGGGAEVSNTETEMEEELLIGPYPFVSRSLSPTELSELHRRVISSMYEGNLTSFVEYVKQGAAHGDGLLHWWLGVLYANGVGVPQSDSRALLHYVFAANEGVLEACMALARRYTDGIGVKKSCEDALEYYREAAEVIAVTYDGMTNPVDPTTEHHHNVDTSKKQRYGNRKTMQVLMVQADSGDPNAILSLGYAFLKGKFGVRRDWHRAHAYFNDALTRGEVKAYGALGRLYATGDSTATPAVHRDLATAAKYFSKGVEREDAVSMNGMGYLYAIGFIKNESSEKTKTPAATEKQQPDYEAAAKFFGESAKRGSVEGAYNLGVLLLHGRGVPGDLDAAIKQFSFAAMRGNVLALWQLARYEERKGNCEKAVQLYGNLLRFSSIFDRTTDKPYLSFADVSDASLTSFSSTSLFIPYEENTLLQFLEMSALAETGHVNSRCQVAEMLDALTLIEERESELNDAVFARSNRPPDRAVQGGGGVIWLEWWYHNSTPSNNNNINNDKNNNKITSSVFPPQLLSQREALNLLRLRLYGACALSGGAEANLRLGDFYYNGESRLVGVDMPLALLHYEAAAGRGSARAYFNLGFMYQLGLGVGGGRRAAGGVGDALYRIITNAVLASKDEEENKSAGESEGTNGGMMNVSKKMSSREIQDAVLSEEMRLYLAKRYYDRAMELNKAANVYAVKFALMSLNFQWWWLHFSRQRYGFSKLLRLSMPMAYIDENNNNNNSNNNEMTATTEPQQEQEEGYEEERKKQEFNAIGTVKNRNHYYAWTWDDYILIFSAVLCLLLLLFRHHAAEANL